LNSVARAQFYKSANLKKIQDVAAGMGGVSLVDADLNKNLQMILGRRNGSNQFQYNDQYKTRSMNQEILNEIYYKKSWDKFKGSLTDQEFIAAQKMVVNSTSR
jgi:hypothetical protein